MGKSLISGRVNSAQPIGIGIGNESDPDDDNMFVIQIIKVPKQLEEQSSGAAGNSIVIMILSSM